MGMFGKRQQAYELTGVERPDLGKRILNQIGMNLLGVDFEGQRLGRALAEKQGDFLTDLGGQLQPGYDVGSSPTVGEGGNAGSWEYQPPVRTRDPLTINSPQLPALALKAKTLGVDLKDLLDVMKAQQPDVRYDRGYGYNAKTGDPMGGFHTELDKGMRPGAGGVVENAPGYVQSAAEAAKAISAAQEGGKAQYDVISLNMPDGSTVQVPRDVAVQGLLQSMAGGGGAGLGRSQTPEAAAAAGARGRTEGEAGAKAAIDLPAIAARANQSVKLIDDLMRDPELNNRLGWWSKVPALPNTAGPGVDAKLDQLQGTAFLQAYNDLKGAGQITEIEGAKAENAIARLKRRDQSPEDYRQALTDLRGVLAGGLDRAAQRAGAPRPAQARPSPSLKTIPLNDRLAEARRRGLIP